MPEQFPVVDVSSWELDELEPGGSDANVWLRTPDGHRVLYKPVVQKDGRRQGEDWAEKVVEQVARLLGVPTARIEMAVRQGRHGLISHDVVPGAGWELQSGGVLIGAIDPRLVPRAKERLGHNLPNICRVLQPLAAQEGLPGGWSAYDQFCTYLLLDALVANPDRHEENWAVLVSPTGAVSLAPSFDHGNSVGFSLLDQRRQQVLKQPGGVLAWARRGCAVRFEEARKTSLLEFARQALERADPAVEEWWRSRLAALPDDAFQVAVRSTPEMSETTRTFCLRVLETNRRRLLDGDKFAA